MSNETEQEAWRSELRLVHNVTVLGARMRKVLIGPGIEVPWTEANLLECLNRLQEERALAEGLMQLRTDERNALSSAIEEKR